MEMSPLTRHVQAYFLVLLLICLAYLPTIGQQNGDDQKTTFSGIIREPSPGIIAEKYPCRTVTFEAPDGLPVSGNLYEVYPGLPIILLCHQANYNKYEYVDIAPRLNEMGYNVLAIDQRSGGNFAGSRNETLMAARAAGISGINFLDAEQDIEAAIDYLYKKYGKEVILWGSSYSSSLAIFIGQAHPRVRAVISFSPGNYFRDAKPSLKEILGQFEKPLFITSSHEEAEMLQNTIGSLLEDKYKVQFIPGSSGCHGSKALWVGQAGAEEYWRAIIDFLWAITSF